MLIRAMNEAIQNGSYNIEMYEEIKRDDPYNNINNSSNNLKDRIHNLLDEFNNFKHELNNHELNHHLNRIIDICNDQYL